MATNKYNLSYLEENGKLVPANKKGKNIFESNLESIDNATTSFETESDLIDFLKAIDAIPTNVDKLHITYNKKDEDGKILQERVGYGDRLFFKKDKKKFNYDYVIAMFEYYKNNPDELLKLCDLYINKYTLTDEQKREVNYKHKYKHFINMLERVRRLVEYADLKKNYYFETCHYTIAMEYEDDIKKFINKEFFRPKTKQSGVKLNYSNLRDFIIKSDIVLSGVPIVKKENVKVPKKEIIEPEEEREEFVTIEDYERDTKKFLKNYEPSFESFQDGNDYIASLTKKELQETYEGYARKYALKPNN